MGLQLLDRLHRRHRVGASTSPTAHRISAGRGGGPRRAGPAGLRGQSTRPPGARTTPSSGPRRWRSARRGDPDDVAARTRRGAHPRSELIAPTHAPASPVASELARPRRGASPGRRARSHRQAQRSHAAVGGARGRSRPPSRPSSGPSTRRWQLTSVGPVVSAELIQQTFLLILMGAVGIMLWITYRFRDFRMGAVALVTLLHDVIVVVGVFAIMGTFIGLQVDALFVTAMLTVIGFSVHDTIVVFDRRPREPRPSLRRAVRRHREPQHPADRRPVHQHLPDRGLHAAGAVPVRRRVDPRRSCWRCSSASSSGTYSSIFTASPLLVDWHLWDERRRARAAGRPGRAPGTTGLSTATQGRHKWR